MSEDKQRDETEEIAATGTDGPRPPSLTARLASSDAKNAQAAAEKGDKGSAEPPALPGLPATKPQATAATSKPAGNKHNTGKSVPPPIPGANAEPGKAKTPPPPLPGLPGSLSSAAKGDNVASFMGLAAKPSPGMGPFEDPLEPEEADTSEEPAAAAEPAEAEPKSDDAAESLRRPSRREARRRPAGPVRERLAANDDAPSIGGLIYALQQKPSGKPFQYAAIASVVWALLGAGALWMVLGSQSDPLSAALKNPNTFLMIAAVATPILVVWFLALLAWRSEELRLRSSTMAEVAIRLAEPDRLAEQSTASLGQAVRRQVGFMNDAVSRALGRAGELEALVHNEVSALERSYEENERKIRSLIQELSGERTALLRTGEDVHATLKSLGSEVPALIEKLSNQQVKLAHIIEGAGENLTLLETSLNQGARHIESSIGNRTQELQTVLDSYTVAVDGALHARTEQMHTMLSDHSKSLGSTLTDTTKALNDTLEGHGSSLQNMLEDHSGRMGKALGETSGNMQGMLETYTGALAEALASRTEQMQEAFEGYMLTLDESISNRTDNLQSVFEAYAQALDTTLATRAESLDRQLVARTRALDDAFNDRLRLFDETIVRTTSAIDDAVGEKAVALTSALDSHAKNFRDTLTRQTAEIDDTLSNGISAVRRSSENVTRQSLKAIEGLASQSDLLKRVSENLLSQINSVTNRFENQGQLIMQAANALESANYKIDSALKQRHTELSGTLDRLSNKADEFSQFIEGYSTTLEDQLSVAEQRAKATAEQLREGTHLHQSQALADLQRFRDQAGEESQRALADLRNRFSSVSTEVSSQFGNLSSRFDESAEELREKAARASQAIEEEQTKLREQLQSIPSQSRESAEAMRRALQDQLNALDQLSQIANREGRNRDISEPDDQPTARLPAAAPGSLRDSYGRQSQDRADTERQLSSLSSSLVRELHERPVRSADHAQGQPHAAHQQPQQAAAPPAGAPRGNPPQNPGPRHPAQGQGDGWSLGDLLKRASFEDEPGEATPPQGAAPAPRSTGALPDVGLMVKAIDTRTAQEIWNRLRSGQRGIMVPSLYPPNARGAFEELRRRYVTEAPLREAIGRFLADFERTVRTAEQQDPSGRQVQANLLSEMGRAYLFLAHVSGRLDK